jgi:hypothetical protein
MKIFSTVFLLICSIYYGHAHLPGGNVYSNIRTDFRSNDFFKSVDIKLDLFNLQVYQKINKDIGYFSLTPYLNLSMRIENEKISIKARSCLLNFFNRVWFPPYDTNNYFHRITGNGLILDNTGFTSYYTKWVNLGYEFGVRTKGANYTALSIGPYIALSSIMFRDNYFDNFEKYYNTDIFDIDFKIQANLIVSTEYLRFENLSSISRILHSDNIDTYESESNIRIPISKILGDNETNAFDFSNFNIVISHKYQKFKIQKNYNEFNEFTIGLNWRFYYYS